MKRLFRMNFIWNDYSRWISYETTIPDEFHMKRLFRMNLKWNDYSGWISNETILPDEFRIKQLFRMNFIWNDYSGWISYETTIPDEFQMKRLFRMNSNAIVYGEKKDAYSKGTFTMKNIYKFQGREARKSYCLIYFKTDILLNHISDRHC